MSFIQMPPGAALLGGLLLLAGCGTEESDNRPPEFTLNLTQRDDKYALGVTDTVVLRFSEPIDTASLELAFVPAEAGKGIVHSFEDRRELRIRGSNRAFDQFHFEIGKAFGVTLSHLADLAGNRRGFVQMEFVPHHWSDLDHFDRTFRGVDTLFGGDGAWKNGRPYSDMLRTEGALDLLTNRQPEDLSDYKLLRLMPRDTLSVALHCPRNMSVEMDLLGPYPEAGFDSLFFGLNPDPPLMTDSTGSAGRAGFEDIVASFDAHFDKLGKADVPGLYVIRLRIYRPAAGFYRLDVTLREFPRR